MTKTSWKPGRKFTLPSGATVRPQSWRRYIVVTRSGVIMYRTDVKQRAEYKYRDEYRQGLVHILDQADGVVL